MKQVLIAFDQLFNAIFGGWADETLSCRAWRLKDTSRFWNAASILIDGAFFWEPDHCQKSYESELERNHLPEEMR